MSTAVARRGWRSLAAPGIATLIAFAILCGLGTWQLQRKAWKEGLLAQIQARAYGPPGAIAPEAAWPSWDAASDEFRRVRVTGTFLNDKEVLVHGLMPGGSAGLFGGYYVFTPLRLADGAVVMVNRGFVPDAFKAQATRSGAQPAGETIVTGLVRAPEIRTAFVPENDPARNEWFVRDIAGMARARDLTRVAPFLIDADATPNPGGWPKGGQTRLTLPNDHLQYAFTWFGLALTLVCVFAVFTRNRLRGGEG